MTDSLERFLREMQFDVPAGLVGRAKRAAIADATNTEALGQMFVDSVRRPRRGDRRREPQLLGLMAAILALAMVITLLVSAQRFHPKAVAPAAPSFQIRAPGVGVCVRTCYMHSPLFISANTGWITEDLSQACHPSCSDKSVLFRTDDGGRRWKAQLTWNHPILKIIASPDGRELLLLGLQDPVGSKYFLFHSTDGGLSWTSLGSPPGVEPQMVSFLDPRDGWVLSSAGLFHTVDGGAHWTFEAPFPSIDVPSHVINSRQGAQFVFQSHSTAWLSPSTDGQARQAYLYESTDGGLDWRNLVLPRPAITDLTSPVYWGLQAVGDQVAAVTLLLNQMQYVYITPDGGATWSNPIPIPKMADLRFLDANHWVGWPADGGWISTSDAGQHWNVTAGSGQPGVIIPGTGLPGWYAANHLFDFISPSQGWAMGDSLTSSPGTTLFETSDGGVNWRPLSLPELS